jgi:hypothetical protein
MQSSPFLFFSANKEDSNNFNSQQIWRGWTTKPLANTKAANMFDNPLASLQQEQLQQQDLSGGNNLTLY